MCVYLFICVYLIIYKLISWLIKSYGNFCYKIWNLTLFFRYILDYFCSSSNVVIFILLVCDIIFIKISCACYWMFRCFCFIQFILHYFYSFILHFCIGLSYCYFSIFLVFFSILFGTFLKHRRSLLYLFLSILSQTMFLFT